MPDAAGAVAEPAPAKINLALHVTGRRSDGYHLIDSLVVFTKFGDHVTLAPAPQDVVEISGPYANGLPVDDSNLVVRAREAVRAYLRGTSLRSADRDISHSLDIRLHPLSIHLEKNLPIASGIGGGSSDAAATLLALNRYWGAGLTGAQLATIGLPLGADIPMCLTRRPLIARGIGEVIEPVTTFPVLPLVLVNPGVGVSTPRIFAALESRESPPLPPLPSALDFAALLDWLGRTRNDLMAPALLLEPAIGEAIGALTAQGAAFARMSGSGATCFGLFADTAMARRAARTIIRARPNWFVVATETTKA